MADQYLFRIDVVDDHLELEHQMSALGYRRTVAGTVVTYVRRTPRETYLKRLLDGG